MEHEHNGHRRDRMRLSRVVAGIYALLCVAALALIPISAKGWFGVEADPLAAVFAIILAMPWSLGLTFLKDLGAWTGTALLAIGMGANVGIILWLGALLRRRRGV